MQQERYAGYARHKQEHEKLLESLSEVRRRFDAGDLESVQVFSSDLLPWFAVHAQTMDAPLAEYLKGH
jgi:hemerythrin